MQLRLTKAGALSFSFFNTGSKAIALANCPHKILVLDITPCDTEWALIRAAAANATRACAARGLRSGTSRCPASTSIPSPRMWQYVIRALKQEVRSVFGPQVTVPGNDSTKAEYLSMSGNHSTKAKYLTMHATIYSQEAVLLKAILSKYEDLTLNVHALKHPVSSELPTAQKKSWCSAISNTSKYTNAALSELL